MAPVGITMLQKVWPLGSILPCYIVREGRSHHHWKAVKTSGWTLFLASPFSPGLSRNPFTWIKCMGLCLDEDHGQEAATLDK